MPEPLNEDVLPRLDLLVIRLLCRTLPGTDMIVNVRTCMAENSTVFVLSSYSQP